MDRLTFDRENRQRIHAVESSFGPSSRSLVKPGRVLMGEGRLLKQSRKKPQTKAFFLFNDVIVYGTVLLNGRLYKKQRIVPLESIKLEDMADGSYLKNQWLIRTPRKSFYVAAPTLEEKHAWMSHIEECKSALLQQQGGYTPSSKYAVSWIPDKASPACMLCDARFTATNRRHHCRMCGLLVCDKCSKDKAVIRHIDDTKKQRVCYVCHTKKQEEESRSRGNSEEDDPVESSDEEEPVDDSLLYLTPSSWLDSRMGTYMTMTRGKS